MVYIHCVVYNSTIMSTYFSLPNIFYILVGVAVFFLVTRELIAWYWKINKVCDLLEKIEANTRPKNVSAVEDVREAEKPADRKREVRRLL